MRKTYQMFLALALMVLGAMNVSADEVISLQDIPFWAHDDADPWDENAPKTVSATPAWEVGVESGQPYGDGSVNAFADLAGYDKLIVTVTEGTEGTPRIMLNRDIPGGQPNANEADAHLIQNTTSGWSDKYFTKEGNVYTVDLKKIYNDKGFVHLHAIKSAAYGQTVSVESMVVTRKGKEKQVGWVNILTNGDFESDG